MIDLILAASLLGSIPSAIEKAGPVIDRACFLIEDAADYKKCINEEISILKYQVAEHERIAVNTWKCFNGSLIGAGADLGTTALALADHPTEVKEANPLGFSVESRIALKFAGVGVFGWGCYVLEKSGHSVAAKITSKVSFWGHMGLAANNFIRTLVLDRQSRKKK